MTDRSTPSRLAATAGYQRESIATVAAAPGNRAARMNCNLGHGREQVLSALPVHFTTRSLTKAQMCAATPSRTGICSYRGCRLAVSTSWSLSLLRSVAIREEAGANQNLAGKEDSRIQVLQNIVTASPLRGEDIWLMRGGELIAGSGSV